MRSRDVSFLFLASLIGATPVAAQMNTVCDDLRGRLADVSQTIGTSHQTRQYSNAIADQMSELAKATSEMRNRGCSSENSSITDSGNAAACDELDSSIDRMQQDLRYLKDRFKDASGGTDDQLRHELESELRDSGCDQPASSGSDTTISNRTDAPPLPEEQAMRTDTFYPPLEEDAPHQAIGGRSAYGTPAGPYGASVRTVCVRTCDGGFFPMTPDATAADFQRDADSCAKMCPGVQTELFFHYLQKETTQMVSASTGAPYSAMPYAFAYKKRLPGERSSCSCNMSAYYDEIKREKAMSDPQPGAPAGSVITGQPQSSITTIQTIKPSTPAPQSTARSEPVKPPEDRPYDPANKVRQVGPQFLSTDQGKIDLRHPAAPGVKSTQ
jgi:hypothetical protein